MVEQVELIAVEVAAEVAVPLVALAEQVALV
jgi:hypothetical protein